MKVTAGFKFTERGEDGKSVRFIPIYMALPVGVIRNRGKNEWVSDRYTTIEEAREEARRLSLLHPHSKKGFTVFDVSTFWRRVEGEPVFVKGKEV